MVVHSAAGPTYRAYPVKRSFWGGVGFSKWNIDPAWNHNRSGILKSRRNWFQVRHIITSAVLAVGKTNQWLFVWIVEETWTTL